MSTTITVRKRENPYLQVEKALIWNPNLSMESVTLFLMMLDKCNQDSGKVRYLDIEASLVIRTVSKKMFEKYIEELIKERYIEELTSKSWRIIV